jgi:NadR type nicotinamide-nucleotide adenylyltransferase
VIRVVVTGSECTGKTTLAAALAERFGAPRVPEYARQFVAETGRAPEHGDVEAIARGQIRLEEELAQKANGLLVQDTDLLSTVVYSWHYYGGCPSWVETALSDRAADLYLLAGIDVPWVADGDQRDRGDRREEMQQLFRQALIDRGLRFVEVAGPAETRLALAVTEVERMLGRAR